MRVDTGRLRVVAAETVTGPEPSSKPELRSSRRRSDAEETTSPSSSEAADDYRSPGPYIKAQRRRRGMSLEQLAAATKIPRAQLELIEADRYEELPGMVFAKGFLRCCARSLELDPDTVLGLLYERERTQLRKRRREGTSSEERPAVPKSKAARRREVPERLQAQIGVWIGQLLERLPSARIVMWLLVALLVALIVFIAFTLASGQAETMMIRS